MATHHEYAFVSKVLADDLMITALQRNITVDYFANKRYSEMWEYMVSHWREYQQPITTNAFLRHFNNIELPDVKRENFDALVEELRDNYKERVLLTGFQEATRLWDLGDTDGTLDSLRGILESATVASSRFETVDLIATWEAQQEAYKKIRDDPGSMMGYSTGFMGLDRLTGGIRKGQVVTLIGMAKAGKSTIQMLMAIAMHRMGLVPMIVGFEMSNEEVADRYNALGFALNHSHLTSGSLAANAEKRWFMEMRQHRNMHPFYIVSDTEYNTTVSTIAAKAAELQPDVIFIDGTYLMSDERARKQDDDWLNIRNVSQDIKKMARRTGTPVVQTTQAKEPKHGKKLTMGDTAYSGSFKQDSDLLIGAERHPEIEDMTILRILAGRNSKTGSEVFISWDWANADWSEIEGPSGN